MRPPRRQIIEVLTDDAWVELPLRDGWTLALRFGVQGQRVAINELRVLPAEPAPRRRPGQWSADVLGTAAPFPPGGITASLVRQITVRKHYRWAAEVFRSLAKRDAEFWGQFAPKGDLLSRADQRPKRGPARQLKDSEVLRVARAYVRARAAGSPRPSMDVAKRLRLKSPRARYLVYVARERGFLTRETGQWGRPGGELVQ